MIPSLRANDMLCRTREMVILGTQYAGEMKKGIFTVMHYLMPKQGILSLHSGCNVGAKDDVTLFFGLSGNPAWCSPFDLAGLMLLAVNFNSIRPGV
jgi:hypothetical protein